MQSLINAAGMLFQHVQLHIDLYPPALPRPQLMRLPQIPSCQKLRRLGGLGQTEVYIRCPGAPRRCLACLPVDSPQPGHTCHHCAWSAQMRLWRHACGWRCRVCGLITRNTSTSDGHSLLQARQAFWQASFYPSKEHTPGLPAS